MQGRKLIITSIITLLALGGGFYLYKMASKQTPSKIGQLLGSPFQKKSETNILESKTPFERSQRKKARTKKTEWQEIGNYPHKEKIIKHFQRFRREKDNIGKKSSPPTVELKLGKLFEKKLPKKTFKLREILVSIDAPKGKRTFVAMVNEDNGKVIKKQGRRITDHLGKVGKKVKFEK